MANLPQNTTYAGQGEPLKAGSVIKITPQSPAATPSSAPDSNYVTRLAATSANLPKLPWSSPDPTRRATEDALQTYAYSQGVPTETPVFPTVDANGNPLPNNYQLPIPSDYSGFVKAGGWDSTTKDGTSGSWITPTNPVIKSFPGDVRGQYVQDLANPNALVKSNRGVSPAELKFIQNGRPGSKFQVDHIVPLELGGADTMANRELLTFSQNQQKTVAQAVPYTLYAHGIISLTEARLMSSQWKDRDIGGLNHPDNLGMIPLQQAQDAVLKWSQPVAPTFKDVMGGIPQAAKDFGKGWMPDSVREFVKGFGSGATFGFLPYEQGDNETTLDKVAGVAGTIVGGFASFMLGGEVIGIGGRVLGTGARLLSATRTAATVAAEAEGLVSASEAVATGAEAAQKAGFGSKIMQAWRNAPVIPAATSPEAIKAAEEAASWIKEPSAFQRLGMPLTESGRNAMYEKTVAQNLLKGLPEDVPANIYRGFVSPLTKTTLKGAGHFALTSVLAGQMSQLVQNKVNPYTLSDQQYVTNEKNLLPRIFGDAVMGATAGVASPTLKGASLAMGPALFIGLMEDPQHPMTAMTNSAIFGAMHLLGAGSKKAEMNELKSRFEAAKSDPAVEAFNYNANRAAYNYMNYWAPKEFPALKDGEPIPASAFSNENLKIAADKARAALDTRKFGDINPNGEDAAFGMNDKTYAKEISRLNLAVGRLGRMDLPPEVQQKLQVQDIITVAKQMKANAKPKVLNPDGGIIGIDVPKSHLDDLWNKWEPRASTDVGKWQLQNSDAITQKTATAVPQTDTVGVGAVFNNEGKEAAQFYTQEPGWNTLPYVEGYVSREMEGVARQGNAYRLAHPPTDPRMVKEIDANPQNYIKLVGKKVNAQTGEIRSYDLGVLPGPERLANINEQTKTWRNPPPDIQSTKDDIAAKADQLGVDKILFNIDWKRTTPETRKSGYPFGVFTTSDQSWADTLAMNKSITDTGITNPYSQHIADIKSSMNAKTVSNALDAVSEHLTNAVTDPASPQDLKGTLERTTNLVLTDKEADQAFALKNNPEVKSGLETVMKAENSGNGRLAYEAQVRFIKTLDSATKRFPEKANLPVTATEEPVTQEPVTQAPDTQSATITRVHTPSIVKISDQLSSKFADHSRSEIAKDLLIRGRNIIDSAVQKGGGSYEPETHFSGEKETFDTPTTQKEGLSAMENLAMKKGVITKEMTPEQRSAAMENWDPGAGGARRMAQDLVGKVRSLEPYKANKVDVSSIKSDVQEQLMRDIALKLHDSFSMPLDDAQAIVDGVVGHRFDAEGSIIPKVTAPKEFKANPDFFKKEPFSKASPYDVLKSRRDQAADDVVKWVETAKSKDPGSYAHSFGFHLDEMLTEKFGKDYAKNPAARQLIGRATGTEGKVGQRWNQLSETVDTSKDLMPFTQTKDYLNALATGSNAAKETAVQARMEELGKYGGNSSSKLSPSELAQLGFEAPEDGGESGFAGAHVTSPLQEENMVHDLSRGDFQLLPGLTSIQAGAEETGAGAVRRGIEDARNVMQFILKGHNDAVASAKKFGGKTNQDYLTLTPKKLYTGRWDNLSKDAQKSVIMKTEEIFNNKFNDYMKRLGSHEVMRKEVPVLKAQIEAIKKAMADPLERSSWQSPEVLQENLDEAFARLKGFMKKQDGKGGPGYGVKPTEPWTSSSVKNYKNLSPVPGTQSKYGGQVGYSGSVKAIKNTPRAGDNRPMDGKGGFLGDAWSGITGAIGSVGNAIGNTFSGISDAINPPLVYNAASSTPAVATKSPTLAALPVRDYSDFPAQATSTPIVPPEYTKAVAQYSAHTGFPVDIAARHFVAENGGKWKADLAGRVDPTDFGITQLNKGSVGVVNGTAWKGAQNYFKQNYGHEFDPKNGEDQILASGIIMNHLKQFDLPQYKIPNPTKADIIMSYNMGAENYAMSYGIVPFKPSRNYPTMADLIKHRNAYATALSRQGIDLNKLALAD